MPNSPCLAVSSITAFRADGTSSGEAKITSLLTLSSWSAVSGSSAPAAVHNCNHNQKSFHLKRKTRTFSQLSAEGVL